MVQLLRSLRRLASNGISHHGDRLPRGPLDGTPRREQAAPAGEHHDPSRQLGSTAEQLDDAAALLEGLGMLRQIGNGASAAPAARERPLPLVVNQAPVVTPKPAPAPTRRSFALHAWMEQKTQAAHRRASRSLVQRLERALAPLAYPG